MNFIEKGYFVMFFFSSSLKNIHKNDEAFFEAFFADTDHDAHLETKIAK